LLVVEETSEKVPLAKLKYALGASPPKAAPARVTLKIEFSEAFTKIELV
jgi:hypothetical protein